MKTLKSLTAQSFVWLALSLFLFASCQKDKGTLSDAEIASVAVTANQIDINYGKIALEKSHNTEVIKFAKTMIIDHENIIKQAVNLTNDLQVSPKDNGVTQSLLDGEKEMKAKFEKLEGEDFDKAYIENEVAYHSDVIAAVKNTLIPQTQNEELKGLLEKVVPLLEQHLEMAKQSQAKILSGEGAATDKQYTDAQIASIAVVANQIDVDYGKIALEKSTNESNRKFAQTMIDDHESIIKAATDLAGKLGVTPDDDNDLTKSLQKGAKDTKAKLNDLSGKEFEKFYISNEVDYHEAVIKAVKEILIPQTENEELKATLESVTPLLDHHLEMAKETQKEIK